MSLPQHKRLVLSACLLLMATASPLHSLGQKEQREQPEQKELDDQENQLDNESIDNVELIAVEPESEPIDEAVYAQALIDRDRYLLIINEIEKNSGQNAYSNELSQAYLNLASTHLTLGDFSRAAETYDQALQTIRISTGLYSLQQLPVLQALLEASAAMGDWQAVDTNAHLIFHINRRNYQVGDSRRVEALNHLGTWKLKAASEDLNGGFRDNADEAADLYNDEIQLLEELDAYEGKNLDLASLYLGEARANIAVARNVLDKPLSSYGTGQPRTTTTQRCRTIRMPNGAVTQVCETVEVPNMQYYIDPSNRKNMEISMALSKIRKAITNSFEVLKEEMPDEQLYQLFFELDETTKAYNAFVTDNLL